MSIIKRLINNIKFKISECLLIYRLYVTKYLYKVFVLFKYN